MKRVLCLAVVAIAGVLSAGSTVKADHYRYSGHHHHGGGHGGGYGGCNRGYSSYSYRPSYGVSVGFGVPVYRQSYYGGYGGYSNHNYGGYGEYGGGYGVPVYNYSGYGNYGGGYCH